MIRRKTGCCKITLVLVSVLVLSKGYAVNFFHIDNLSEENSLHFAMILLLVNTKSVILSITKQPPSGQTKNYASLLNVRTTLF